MKDGRSFFLLVCLVMKRQLCIYSPNTLLYPLYLLYYIHYILKMFWVVLVPHNCFYWFLNEHMWSLILLLFFFTWNLYYFGLTLKPLIFSMKCVASKPFKDRRNSSLQTKSMTWSLSFFFFSKTCYEVDTFLLKIISS